jgi:ABC-type multidrug transport system ATPase subunit
LGVGDAAFVEKSKAVMRDRIRSGTTVVLVSHSTNEIRSVCDRVVWIERGRQMMEGKTEEILKAYSDWIHHGTVPPQTPGAASTDSPSGTIPGGPGAIGASEPG